MVGKIGQLQPRSADAQRLEREKEGGTERERESTKEMEGRREEKRAVVTGEAHAANSQTIGSERFSAVARQPGDSSKEPLHGRFPSFVRARAGVHVRLR